MSVSKLLIRSSILALFCANGSLFHAAGDVEGSAESGAELKLSGTAAGGGASVLVVSKGLPTGRGAETDEEVESLLDLSHVSSFTDTRSVLSSLSATGAGKETIWDPSYRPSTLQKGMKLKDAVGAYNKAKGQYRLLRKLFDLEREEKERLLNLLDEATNSIILGFEIDRSALAIDEEESFGIVSQEKLNLVIATAKTLFSRLKDENRAKEAALKQKEDAEAKTKREEAAAQMAKEVAAIALRKKEESVEESIREEKGTHGEEVSSNGRYTLVGYVAASAAGGVALGILLKSLWPAIVKKINM